MKMSCNIVLNGYEVSVGNKYLYIYYRGKLVSKYIIDSTIYNILKDIKDNTDIDSVERIERILKEIY